MQSKHAAYYNIFESIIGEVSASDIVNRKVEILFPDESKASGEWLLPQRLHFESTWPTLQGAYVCRSRMSITTAITDLGKKCEKPWRRSSSVLNECLRTVSSLERS